MGSDFIPFKTYLHAIPTALFVRKVPQSIIHCPNKVSCLWHHFLLLCKDPNKRKNGFVRFFFLRGYVFFNGTYYVLRKLPSKLDQLI